MREFLQGAVKELLAGLGRQEEKRPRLVIFIDDLDRCSSEAAYRLLEGLKIHLNLPNCVFVLGMNQGAVVDLLAQQFAKNSSDALAGQRAESYLEKLCANIWRLPRMTDPMQTLSHWLAGERVLASAEPEPIGDQALKNGFSGLQKRDLLNSCLPPNPRKLKALANTLLMFWDSGACAAIRASGQPQDPLKQDPLKWECFLFVAYVYQFHQGLYQRWVLNGDFFELMKEWSQGKPLHPERKAIFDNIRLVAAPSVAAGSDDKLASSSLAPAAPLSLYPEPGLHGLFWMAPWLLDPTGGQLATAKAFEPFLRVHLHA
jgi:hypothetical protein